MKLLDLKKSSNKDKKFMAVFELAGSQKTTHFGSAGSMDYTKYSDRTLADQKQKLYLDRHRKNENWDDPTSAGALSRWILWSEPTVDKGIRAYKKRFSL